jgi:ABC-2 type transport system ATP-binding protein
LPEDVVLEVKNARKEFSKRVALNGVDLTLRAGEIYVLLGANGAGKTTLLRAICGRVAMLGGTIRVGGRDPRVDRAARRLLGVVPQSVALYPHLTARENLLALGRLAGVRRSALRPAVDSVLDRIGLGERADDPTHTLSGGMQRRLNIAAGALHEPRLLLLDEPTVGVDPGAREQIHEMLLTLRQRGVAILMTTHDLDQAEAMADRVGFLIDGEIRLEGSPKELVRTTFGSRREIAITLTRGADRRASALLEEQGLQPMTDGLTWIGTLSGEFADLSRIAANLGAAGLPVDELRVREPGLRGIYFRLAGKDLAS